MREVDSREVRRAIMQALRKEDRPVNWGMHSPLERRKTRKSHSFYLQETSYMQIC